MKLSEKVKLRDKLLEVFNEYAFLAREWDIEDEDDYESFKDALLDVMEDKDDEG